MTDNQWQPDRFGRCGECGGKGHITGHITPWADETGSGRHPATMVHYLAVQSACSCGAIWWEQFRWRGQTQAPTS